MKIRDDLYFVYAHAGPGGGVKAALIQGAPPRELLPDKWGPYSRAILRPWLLIGAVVVVLIVLI